MVSSIYDMAAPSTANECKLRSVRCELNPLTRSDGSAMYGQGSTIVIAAMLGPIEVKSQNLSIDNSHIECNFRPKAGLPSVRDKIQESIIKDVCELSLLTDMYPRTKMSVQVQELEDRGGLEACAINSACMALLIGGLPMKFTFAAVHCIVDNEGKLMLDPDDCQMHSHRASFTFVFDSLERNLLSIQTRGAFKIAELNDAECLCRAASTEVFDFYRSCILDYHNKTHLTAQAVEDTQESVGEPMDRD